MQPSAPTLIWGLPFAGLLASMAVLPIVAPRFWQRRLGIVALTWSGALIVSQAIFTGVGAAAEGAWHAVLIEYLPFMAMLLALYTAGGGVLVRGGPAGTPLGNTAMLALGVVVGSVAGTTGASMVLIHPMLHANAHRTRKVHLVLFLIILVANASITPLGNPPLYIGLLHGVPFFWPVLRLLAPLLLVTSVLLVAFYLIDARLARSDPPRPASQPLRIRGWWNIALILVVILVVLLHGQLDLGRLVLLGQPVRTTLIAGVAILAAVTLVSAAVTARAIRQANDFTWHPIVEVAKLFAAIFVTIAPVTAMLRAGLDGPLAPILQLTRNGDGLSLPLAYFWLTGILSAFLDNAPTYLVFFELAGVEPAALSGAQAQILVAISAGAVFFGGLTYIGNAPNMMLRAIAAHRGVRMPGFFGYMVPASALLLPVLAVMGLLFFL
jgi:Na+/H+ antiporter NhaD/arsenite permease-like protein